MKTLVRVAVAALSFASVGPAWAGEGEGMVANSQFTLLSGVVADAPVQNALVASVKDGHDGNTYATKSTRGTWLFPNYDTGGDN